MARLARRLTPRTIGSDVCLFCDTRVDAADTDAIGFRDHLKTHSHCASDYAHWKQVISEEWLAD